MTPKENIIKPQVVMLNSPKKNHGSSSPGKIKGSFLHKALSADNTDRASPFKVCIDVVGKQFIPVVVCPRYIQGSK